MDLSALLLGVLAALGGSSGIIAVVLNHRAGSRKDRQDATERLSTRLEQMYEDEQAYVSILINALVAAGVPVPARPVKTKG